MKFFEKIGLATLVTSTLVALPLARAEMVYENEIQQDGDAPSATGESPNERESLRQVVGSSRKAEIATAPAAAPARVVRRQVVAQPAPVAQVVQAAPVYAAPVAVQAAPVMIAQAAPVAAAPAAAPVVVSDAIEPEAPAALPAQEVQHLSKSELLRRARLREELKNEDVLQERLEELRLRDERRRTDQVLGASKEQAAPVAMAPAPVMKEEIVGAPIGAAPQAQAIPVQTQAAQAQPVQAYYDDRVAASSAQAQSVASPEEEKTRISVTPRAGISNLAGTNYFNVQARYSAGLALGVEVSEQISFQVGYLYSEYGIGVASSNPYIGYLQASTGSAYSNNFATYILRQNVFDAGLKFHVLGKTSKLRPYLGGGAAYARSFLNYDATVLSALNQTYGAQSLATDYSTSAFLGFLQAGMDVSLGKNILLGAEFRYYNVLSATENQSLNTGGFYTGYNPDPNKSIAGGSLARSNFYSVLGTASFTF